MDEIVKLETKIADALIAGTVPDSLVSWAQDALCNSHDTRLERLRTIVKAIERKSNV